MQRAVRLIEKHTLVAEYVELSPRRRTQRIGNLQSCAGCGGPHERVAPCLDSDRTGSEVDAGERLVRREAAACTEPIAPEFGYLLLGEGVRLAQQPQSAQ